MSSFALDPVIHVRHPQYPVLRTIEDAADLVRAIAATRPQPVWRDMLRAFERVRTEEDALEAAVALEGILDNENMLIETAESGNVKVPVRSAAPVQPKPAPARGLSAIYATARAQPNH